MTKETIIKSALKYLVKRQIEEGSVGFAVDNDHDHDCCWDDVLAWIEAQSCENAVSREAVIRLVEQYPNIIGNRCGGLISDIKHLPSVTPQRPKGKWMEIEIDAGEFIYKCTKCGMRVINPYKYCPNCGAEMGGTDEVSD